MADSTTTKKSVVSNVLGFIKTNKKPLAIGAGVGAGTGIGVGILIGTKLKGKKK